MSYLAIIPARKHSRRLPGKNTAELGGLPLISWTLKFALSCAEISRIIVSTDDPEILKIAHQFGINVAKLRPSELAQDSTSTLDVCKYELISNEIDSNDFDGIIILQPTSPFRSSRTFSEAIAVFVESDKQLVVTVKRNEIPRSWLIKRERESGLFSKQFTSNPMEKDVLLNVPNGNLYIASYSHIVASYELYTNTFQIVKSSSLFEDIDIDYEEDLEFARKICEKFVGL